jgi:hypothetical protein
MKESRFLIATFLLFGLYVPAFCQQSSVDDLTQDQRRSITLRVVDAIQIAKKVQSESLEGYLAIIVDEKAWEAATEDGDMGPWVKLNAPKAERSVVLLMSPTADAGVAVFYDGDVPFGIAAAHSSKKKQKIPEADIAASYKLFKAGMLEMGSGSASLTPGFVKTDGGISMLTFTISFKKNR